MPFDSGNSMERMTCISPDTNARPTDKIHRWKAAARGITILLLAAALASCNLINPEEEVPAYLYLQPFQLQTNTAGQGTASEKITEAWLSVDGEFLGAYTLPALVPVLQTGDREITLQPGIRDNGISSTPEIYPFYDIYRTTVTLERNEVDTLRPRTEYTDRTKFAFIDDFDRSVTIFRDIRIGTPDNELRAVEDMVFEGQVSGRIRLDQDHPAVELATIPRFRNLTENSPYLYLEVNYKSQVPVVFGIVGYNDGGTGLGTALFESGFREREDWNKIYLNLSPLLAENNFDEYQIALQALLPQEGGAFTREEAFIWLDNIKLVHF